MVNLITIYFKTLKDQNTILKLCALAIIINVKKTVGVFLYTVIRSVSMGKSETKRHEDLFLSTTASILIKRKTAFMHLNKTVVSKGIESLDVFKKQN